MTAEEILELMKTFHLIFFTAVAYIIIIRISRWIAKAVVWMIPRPMKLVPKNYLGRGFLFCTVCDYEPFIRKHSRGDGSKLRIPKNVLIFYDPKDDRGGSLTIAHEFGHLLIFIALMNVFPSRVNQHIVEQNVPEHRGPMAKALEIVAWMIAFNFVEPDMNHAVRKLRTYGISDEDSRLWLSMWRSLDMTKLGIVEMLFTVRSTFNGKVYTLGELLDEISVRLLSPPDKEEKRL